MYNSSSSKKNIKVYIIKVVKSPKRTCKHTCQPKTELVRLLFLSSLNYTVVLLNSTRPTCKKDDACWIVLYHVKFNRNSFSIFIWVNEMPMQQPAIQIVNVKWERLAMLRCTYCKNSLQAHARYALYGHLYWPRHSDFFVRVKLYEASLMHKPLQEPQPYKRHAVMHVGSHSKGAL